MQPGEPAKEPIKLYLDDQEEPFKTAEPPIRFRFSTIHLPDGPHTLRIEASNGLAPPTIKSIPFAVRNGVALSLSGLEPNQTIGGQVELIINAYAGNTEVDFEPRQAETPQPIPTWAWVLLLAVLSWTLYYLVTPRHPESEESFEVERSSPVLGRRLYVDTCARCHGEDGRGRKDPVSGKQSVSALRNTKELGVARSPFKLLSRVVTGVPDTQMPAWGPEMSNEQIVAVVNHVRTWWGHDASTITMSYRYPPKEIEVLECNLAEAMKTKNLEQMAAWGWPTISQPVLFRTGDDKGGDSGPAVKARWGEYFEGLCDGEVTDFKLREVRYDYEPETADQEGSYVIAMGRIYQESLTHGKKKASAKGRFIRVYQLKKGLWNLALDFADIPFEVGCAPEDLEPATDDAEGEGDAPAPAPAGDGVGYAQIQAIFEGVGKNAKNAPHMNFWELPYQEFIDFRFPFETETGDMMIPMMTPYSSKTSNLVLALRGKTGIIACGPNGAQTTIEIPRPMPVGGAISEDLIAKIAAWIDAGCPEHAGQPSALERKAPEDILCGGGGAAPVVGAGGRQMLGGCGNLMPTTVDPHAGHVHVEPGSAGFPTPGGNDGGGGFPTPGGNDSGGGFPAPGGGDNAGGGFPAPGGGDAGGGGFPAPGGGDAGGGGFPPPGGGDAGGGGFPPPGGGDKPGKDAGGGFPPPGGGDNPGGGFPPPGGDAPKPPDQPKQPEGPKQDDPKQPDKPPPPPQFPPPEDPPAGRGK